MRQLIILLIEFFLIIAAVAGIYYVNAGKKSQYSYNYKKPLLSKKLNLSDTELKKEIDLFLARELGLSGGEFQVVDVVSLYTNDISGSDYIVVTLKAPDGRLCQITLSRSSLPWSKWELNPQTFSVLEAPKPLWESELKVPKWMQDLDVTPGQLHQYYSTHPDAALKGEAAFLDPKTGKYNLPSDWYQTVYTLVIEKEKTMRLKAETGTKAKEQELNTYWKPDYSTEYMGPGYREYLYDKIKNKN